MCAIVYSVCNYPMSHVIVCLGILLLQQCNRNSGFFPRSVSYLQSLSAISFLVSDIMCVWIHVNSSHMFASRTFLLAVCSVTYKCACFIWPLQKQYIYWLGN